MHDQDVALGVVRDLGRHAAVQQPTTGTLATAADHDQVGADLLGDVEDGLGAALGERVAHDVEVVGAQRGDGLVDDLNAWAVSGEQVAELGGYLLGEATEFTFSDRAVAADDMDPGWLEPLGELRCSGERSPGRERAIGADDDGVEHGDLSGRPPGAADLFLRIDRRAGPTKRGRAERQAPVRSRSIARSRP